MTVSLEIWGLLSVALAAASLVPYFFSVLAGKTKPHMFSWAIWALLTIIAFSVQFSAGAGPGAWATGFSAAGCLFILVASFRYGEKNITRSDWVTFILALAAIPLWLVTENAALAAVWVTMIDGLGFWPTMRKSWFKPYEEMATSHGLSMIKHALSFMAMDRISVATAFYPAALVVLNAILISIIAGRRYGPRLLKRAKPDN